MSPPAPRAPVELPPPPRPAGNYVPVVLEDGRAWVSGQVVVREGRAVSPGRVDAEVTVPEAQRLAREAALQALSALQEALGDLAKIARVLRVVVYVASSPGFTRQHEVANGATDALVEVLGERGRPARSALGVAALPLNAPVEVEMVVATR